MQLARELHGRNFGRRNVSAGGDAAILNPRGGLDAEGTQLLSEESVTAMTANQLTPAQIAAAGMLLDGQGWGYGMAVITTANDLGMTLGAAATASPGSTTRAGISSGSP